MEVYPRSVPQATLKATQVLGAPFANSKRKPKRAHSKTRGVATGLGGARQVLGGFISTVSPALPGRRLP